MCACLDINIYTFIYIKNCNLLFYINYGYLSNDTFMLPSFIDYILVHHIPTAFI